jgi:hypothetical protein
MISEELYKKASKEIDEVHSEDLVADMENGESVPAELLYSKRMLKMLDTVEAGSSNELKLAAQCQHLKRWGVPRNDYTYNRTGYLQWRRAVMEFQLQETKAILLKVGLDNADILNITDILRNQGNKSHSNAQIMEDTACLVFLKWYLEPFLSKHESGKVIDILRKTMRKMSDKGISLVSTLNLPSTVSEILKQVA